MTIDFKYGSITLALELKGRYVRGKLPFYSRAMENYDPGESSDVDDFKVFAGKTEVTEYFAAEDIDKLKTVFIEQMEGDR